MADGGKGLAKGTYEAHPPGTELWYADIGNVRRVRVSSLEVVVRDASMQPFMVRHHLEPADKAGPLDACTAPKALLSHERAVAEAAVRARREEVDLWRERATPPDSDRVAPEIDVLKAVYAGRRAPMPGDVVRGHPGGVAGPGPGTAAQPGTGRVVQMGAGGVGGPGSIQSGPGGKVEVSVGGRVVARQG